MMPDAVSIVGGWGGRAETAEACAARFGVMVDEIAKVHPAFSMLFWHDAGAGVATRDITELRRRGELSRLFKPQKVYDEEKRRRFNAGFMFTARSDDNFPPIVLTLRVGNPTGHPLRRWHSNWISIAFVVRGNLFDATTTYPSLRPTLHAVRQAWRADWVGAYSTRYAQYASRPDSFPYSGAWMMYLAEPHAGRIVAPPLAIVERVDDGGLLFKATDDIFAIDNVAHLAAADAIQTALAALV